MEQLDCQWLTQLILVCGAMSYCWMLSAELEEVISIEDVSNPDVAYKCRLQVGAFRHLEHLAEATVEDFEVPQFHFELETLKSTKPELLPSQTIAPV